MNVGLPGTGIGGLFYLLTALLMPLIELVQTLRGRSSVARWRTVLHQFTLALGVLLGLWVAAWLLKLLLPHQAVTSLKTSSEEVHRHFGVTPTLLTLATLAAVLAAVELVYLLQQLKRRLPRFLHGLVLL